MEIEKIFWFVILEIEIRMHFNFSSHFLGIVVGCETRKVLSDMMEKLKKFVNHGIDMEKE